MNNKQKKDSVSISIYIGSELFEMLNKFCAITGQSKTIAVERAITAYCKEDNTDIKIEPVGSILDNSGE
jgi:hypothetical protein